MPEASAWPAIMHGMKISPKAPRAMMGLIRRKRADLATSPDHSSSVTISFSLIRLAPGAGPLAMYRAIAHALPRVDQGMERPRMERPHRGFGPPGRDL